MQPKAKSNKRLSAAVSQSFVLGDESSDFSVDEQSTLLELMQKLKKVDPESLILNFKESDDPDLESEVESNLEDHRVGDNSDDQSMNSLAKRRQDFFVFAAYIPPGKHLVLLRDVETKVYKKHQVQQ